jgi:hypothetical protein
VFCYIEYISRRPGVSIEAFHALAGHGQSGWAGEYGEDQLILNVGRTWRTGPEPEYFAAWANPTAGLDRIDAWERIFKSGEAAAFEEPFKLAARIDRAGCYETLLDPVPGSGGPYYAEFLDVAPGATRADVRDAFAERQRAHEDLTLNLLVDRIGGLGPDPRALAVWSAASYGAMDAIARSLDGVTSPVRLATAALYRDLGDETL